MLKKAVLGVALLSGVVLAHPVKPVTRHETKAQERFEHVKANIINMIDKRVSFLHRRIDFLQRHKVCVEKAQNWKELRACRPHKYTTHHRKMWHKPMKKVEHK